MRIAIFSWESLYTIQVGGLGVAVTLLAEELARQGHQVGYFTRGAPGQPQYMKINGVDYFTLPVEPVPDSYSFALGMSRHMVDRLHSIEETFGRFEVIHGNDWLVVDALQELKAEGRSIVMTYHSTEYGRNGGRMGNWPSFAQISDRERFAGEIADRVTTVSEYMRGELNWLYGIPREKIAVVPNAIDRERYQLRTDAGSVKKSLGIHPFAPTILLIGRMEYQKGPDLLVEAAPEILSRHPDVVFVYVGRGQMTDYLQRRAAQLGVLGSFRFLGFLPHWEFLEKLNSCDLVCVPSRNEPFGMVLLEAWAAGKPVVASSVGGLGENIDHMVNGYKVNPDSGSVARGISHLLENPGVMRDIAVGGAGRLADFSWDRSVEMVLEVYRESLGT